MTDQQKGYGLGIILGIRLPCLRDARAGRGVRATLRLYRPRATLRLYGPRATLATHATHATRRARTRLSLYPHITSTYIRRDKFDQNVNTVVLKTI